MPFARGNMRDHIVSQRPRSFVWALRSIAVAEPAKNQLFARFSVSFNFRLLQHNPPGAHSCAAQYWRRTTSSCQRGLIKLAVNLYEGELSELRRIFSRNLIDLLLGQFFWRDTGRTTGFTKKGM